MTTLNFDQMLDVVQLRAALAEATGKGILVAILDAIIVAVNALRLFESLAVGINRPAGFRETDLDYHRRSSITDRPAPRPLPSYEAPMLQPSLVVHDATQMIAPSANALARLFGLRKEQVRVLSPFVGGGFGGKGLWDHQVVAVAAAKLVGRPVRLMLSRESVYRSVGGRSPTEQRVAIGADG